MRSDGLWIGRIRLGYRPDGKENRRGVSGHTRDDVRAKLAAIRKQAEEGRLPDVAYDRMTVAAFLTHWQEGLAGTETVRESTRTRYGQIVKRHLIPALGRHQLRTLGPHHIVAMYAAKREAGTSAANLLKIHSVLHVALEQAVKWHAIMENPAHLIDRPKVERPEIEPPSVADVGALLEAARDADDALAPLWEVAAYSGCRKGELLGVKWPDIDLEAGTLTVRRTLARIVDHAPVFGEPKTRRSRRRVMLPEDAIGALRQQHRRQAAERLAAGPDYAPYDLVFATSIGTPLAERWVTKRFKAALARVALPQETRFHDLRHFAATLMLAAGVHPKVASERLGHSTVGITLDLYTHAVESLDQDAAQRMQEAINRAKKSQWVH